MRSSHWPIWSNKKLPLANLFKTKWTPTDELPTASYLPWVCIVFTWKGHSINHPIICLLIPPPISIGTVTCISCAWTFFLLQNIQCYRTCVRLSVTKIQFLQLNLHCTELDYKACMVLNFPLLPHGLPLSAPQQFLEKLAYLNHLKPYSLTQ